MQTERPPKVTTEEIASSPENHPSVMEESLNKFFEEFKKENEGYIKGGTIGAVVLGFKGAFENFIKTEKNVKKNSTEYIHTLIGLIFRDFDNINTKRKYTIMLDKEKDEEVREIIGKYLLKLSSEIE